MRPNILLITLDQFRADALGVAGGVVETPHLDFLARQGVRFSRHYSQSAPCAPGRASLYTGMYQMNHRVVFNGTPLDERFDNLARLGQRAGYEPTLFGYTDQALDPRATNNPNDPRLFSYEGVLPGFICALDLVGAQTPWLEHLARNGFDSPLAQRGDAAEVSSGALSALGAAALRGESERPEELSISAFLTDHLCDWLDSRSDPWFAHASYMRPHPPYAAAGAWSKYYDLSAMELPISPALETHPFHAMAMKTSYMQTSLDDDEQRFIKSQYYGMISEVDSQLKRVWAKLQELNVWDDTVIILTSDHGDQLGDHGLQDKGGYFEESYHIPAIVRDPSNPQAHGSVVDRFTENVDIFPTIAELLNVPVPLQCDGRPLTSFLRGDTPPDWRQGASWEFDWRALFINDEVDGACQNWPADRTLESQNLAVYRNADAAYVQFGDGSWTAFDLVADPTWRTAITDPTQVLSLAQDMLAWRAQNTERTLSGMLIRDGGVGRWPEGVSWH